MDIYNLSIRLGWACLVSILSSCVILAGLTHGQPNVHVPNVPVAQNQNQRQQQVNMFNQQQNDIRFQQQQQQQQQLQQQQLQQQLLHQQQQQNLLHQQQIQGNNVDSNVNRIQNVPQQQQKQQQQQQNGVFQKDGQTYRRVGNQLYGKNGDQNYPDKEVDNKQQKKLDTVKDTHIQVADNRVLVDKELNKNQLGQDQVKDSLKESVNKKTADVGVVNNNVANAVQSNPLNINPDTHNAVPAVIQRLGRANIDNQHVDSAVHNVKADIAPKAKTLERNLGGEFDLAKLPKENKNDNLEIIDKVDVNMANNEEKSDGKPDYVKVVDGGLKKNVERTGQDKAKLGNEAEDEEEEEDDEDDEEYDENQEDDNYEENDKEKSNTAVGDSKNDNGDNNDNQNKVRVLNPLPESNEIPRNNGEVAHNSNEENKINVPNKIPTVEQDKEGSLKVVWDWSDFAVNFEQYVMPEQKIRRAPHASTGEPWPMPQYYVTKKDKVFQIDKTSFRFKLSKVKCDIIDKALERYKLFILEDSVEDMYDNFQNAQSTMFEDPAAKYESPLYMEAPSLSLVSVKIRKPCAKYLTPKSDESYDLFVKRTGVHIWANEVWGALRGLETLSQLIFKGTNQKLYIRDTVINDYPRFSHRGIMIDSSRHFLFKETIYDVLEAMTYNKMNVLHWHLVDDQSFPFYSQVYPDLSAKGAFHPAFVYMPEDIADVIEFARIRGIRVEPEFDTPGHTYSWGLSRPDLLTQCYQGDRPVDGYLGPLDPSKNETFRFLKNFFKDVLHQFKDEYIHLGGDEVPMTCWQSNPEVMKFLAKLEGRPESEVISNDPYYYSYDIRKVLEYYVNRVIKDIKSLSTKRSSSVRMVFWQEIMNNNVQLPNDTIIHVWSGGMEDIQRATGLGLNVLYSSCWYINLIEYGTKWSKYYQCDPADTTYGYSIDESKVLGGEACIWSEYIDNENLMSTLWPSASATAERLWSNKAIRDFDAAAPRLQEHRCRMLSRGLTIGQISGPDYCLHRGKRRHLLNETSLNCNQSQCSSYSEKSRVEVEKIKVEFEQKGAPMSDCSQAVVHAGGQLTLVLILLIVIAVGVTLKVTKQKMIPVRLCRNKTILMVFITLILVYFLCYTSIWMQALQFKGTFEKRISSNIS